MTAVAGSTPSARAVLAIALPALGALAAEPLFLLADTAIIGHLGTRQLAALALAATLLSSLVALCNFLAYGTTGQVARLSGAGEHRRAGALGMQALWLAIGIGVALAIACVALAPVAMRLLGGARDAGVPELATGYLRISALGLPAMLAAVAAQGFLRGIGDLRTPLVAVSVCMALNVALNATLVYGAGWGLNGSAVGTVIAQLTMACWLGGAVLAHSALAPPDRRAIAGLAHVGGHIIVRTGSLLASFMLAGAVLARVGPASLAAHQIGFQIFMLLALALDALAIAAQVLVGRLLGAGDGDGALSLSLRMCRWALAGGIVLALVLLPAGGLIPRGFTTDPAVLAQARELWPLLALMIPVGAVVFALDGILLGAGDTRYLAIAMAAVAGGVFVPIALAALWQGWGVRGVWCGLVALMVGRLATLWPRLVGRRWMRLGSDARG